MASERKIRRYSTYFQGWATAFGNHHKHFDEKRDLLWLLGKDQIGLILPSSGEAFLRTLFRGEPEESSPQVELGPGALRIVDLELRFGDEVQPVLDVVMGLLKGGGDLHLLQTYHLVYPSGTRILTLTRQSPLPLVYREIEPLRLRLI